MFAHLIQQIIFFQRKDGVRVKSVLERYCRRPATINLSIVFEIRKIVFQMRGISGYVYKCDKNTPCFQKREMIFMKINKHI